MSGLACIVIGRHLIRFKRQRDILLLARCQFIRLGICSQGLLRLAKLALRRTVIHLYNFFSRISIAGIRNSDINADAAIRLSHIRCLNCKISVSESISERIHYAVLGKRLKIAVSHINILCIIVIFCIPEIRSARIIFIRIRNRLRQLSRRSDRTAQHICNSISTLHAALPYIQDTVQIVIVTYPAHVDQGSYIKQYDHVLKVIICFSQHILFQICQIPASRFKPAFTIFSGGTPDHDNRRIAVLRGICNHLVIQRHLRVRQRPVSPSACTRNMLAAPLLIYCCQFLIDLDCRIIPESFEKVHCIRYLYIPAGAISARKIINLYTSEYRNLLHRRTAAERKYLVIIFQHDNSFCRCLSRRISKSCL